MVDEIKNIICIGTGNMGPATALRYAVVGHNVTMTGRSEASLKKGLEDAAQKLQELVQAGEVDETAAPAILAQLKKNALVVRFDQEFSAEFLAVAAQADAAIESAVEEAEAKQQIFARLDKVCPEHTRFYTNSSALPVSVLISGTKDDVVNPDGSIIYGTKISESRMPKIGCAHHWSPAHLLDAAELLVGIFPEGSGQQKTAAATLEFAEALLRQAGITPVRMNKEIEGFIGNRIQIALLRAAYSLMKGGAYTPAEIDAAVRRGFGHYAADVGPLEDAQRRGLDALTQDTRDTAELLALSNGVKVPQPLKKAIKAGRLGLKPAMTFGQGIYDWGVDALAAIRKSRVGYIFKTLGKDRQRAAGLDVPSTYPTTPKPESTIAKTLRLAVLRESLYLLNTGIASAADIDLMVKKTMGRRWKITGPIESADLGGLDIFNNIFQSTGHTLCNEPNVAGMFEQAQAAGLLPTLAVPTRPSQGAVMFAPTPPSIGGGATSATQATQTS